MPAPVTIGFDIGGTNLRAGVIEGTHVIERLNAPTPSDATVAEDTIVDMVDTIRSRYEVDAVGLAVAGFLDPECETVRFAPHLPWKNAALRATLEERLGLPVRLEHDANSAAWGEYRFGAGAGAGMWVFFAVGTGIGATIMTNGSIYRGAYGTAPEFGHITVVHGPKGRVCSCGKTGCLERYASGTALTETAAELASGFPGSELQEALATSTLVGTDVVAAARRGDDLAQAVIEDFARWLGYAFAMVVDICDPELIVLGGGVADDADLYLARAEEVMSESIVGAGYRPLPRVAVAELGAAAGMIGVADLAKNSR